MPALNMFHRIPGLTESQAEKRAQRFQRLGEEKEKYVVVRAPGDVSVRATNTVNLSGTGTAFDQLYYIETVEHHFSIMNGYEMTITAKNSGTGDSGYSPGSGDSESPPVGTPTQLPGGQGFTVVT